LYTTYYQDSDGDGYGNSAVTESSCSASNGYVADNTDCNDTNANIYPGNEELCDGLDNDCNGDVDDGAVFNTYYLDADGDGFSTGANIDMCLPDFSDGLVGHWSFDNGDATDDSGNGKDGTLVGDVSF